MRPFLLALLVLTASAGCLGAPDAESAEATPAAPSPSPVEEPAPATPPADEPAAAPAEPPAAPAPPAPPATPRKEVYNASFDFASQGDPSGQNPKAQATTPVLAGHGTLFVNVTLARSTTTPTAVPISGTLNSPAVRILDPSGNEVLAFADEGAASQQVPAAPGEWTVRYEGAGTLHATVTLVAVA